MPTEVIAPNDGLLHYSGFVHEVERTSKRANFDRDYGEEDLDSFGPAMWYTGGLRVSWRSDARHTAVHVLYKRCEETCAVDLNKKSCYLGHRRGCRNASRLSLAVDSQLVDAPGLVEDEVWLEEDERSTLELPVQSGGPHDCASAANLYAMARISPLLVPVCPPWKAVAKSS